MTLSYVTDLAYRAGVIACDAAYAMCFFLGNVSALFILVALAFESDLVIFCLWFYSGGGSASIAWVCSPDPRDLLSLLEHFLLPQCAFLSPL
jgi:hypothetical protein